MILGLDLSSRNSGYAVFSLHPEDGGSVSSSDSCNTSFTQKLEAFGSIIPPKNEANIEKIRYIYEAVKTILTQYPITTVAIEDQHYGINAQTLMLLSRICGVCLLAANQAGCPSFLYAPTTVKKYFTGSGRAKKKDMVKTAIERYQIEEKIDDNIADAIGVGYTYIQRQLRSVEL